MATTALDYLRSALQSVEKAGRALDKPQGNVATAVTSAWWALGDIRDEIRAAIDLLESEANDAT